MDITKKINTVERLTAKVINTGAKRMPTTSSLEKYFLYSQSQSSFLKTTSTIQIGEIAISTHKMIILTTKTTAKAKIGTSNARI